MTTLKKLGFNKGGNVLFDGIVPIFVLFVLAIVVLVTYLSFSEMTAEITPELTHVEANESLTNLESRFPSTFDGIFALAFVFLWIAVLVASFI